MLHEANEVERHLGEPCWAVGPRPWVRERPVSSLASSSPGASTPFSVRMVTATAYDGKFAASLLATTTCHSLFASLCLPIRHTLADACQAPRDVSADDRQRVGQWDVPTPIQRCGQLAGVPMLR
jgi:hypothetical protein